jgi:hypothetical protein
MTRAPDFIVLIKEQKSNFTSSKISQKLPAAMNIDYTLTPDQLSNAVYNTILVFDEYSLRKQMDREGRQLIMDTSWKGTFSYFITEMPGGSRLTLAALATKLVSADELVGYEESFLKNLYKIIDKEITITPELANTDIYKKRQVGNGLKRIIWIVIVIVMAILFLIGFIFVGRAQSPGVRN